MNAHYYLFLLKNLKNFEKFSQLKYPSSRTQVGQVSKLSVST